jgi:hypothetical protein
VVSPSTRASMSAPLRRSHVGEDVHGGDVGLREPATDCGRERRDVAPDDIEETDPGRAQEVLQHPAHGEIDTERANIDVHRADRLEAVQQHQGATLMRQANHAGHVDLRAVAVASSIRLSKCSSGTVRSAASGACSTTAPRDVWACQIWAPVGNARLETRTLLRGSEKSSALARLLIPTEPEVVTAISSAFAG